VTSFRGQQIKIWDCKPYPLQGPAGSVIEILDDGFVVSTGDGGILVQRVQPEGCAKISAVDFINGSEINKGVHLGT